jgi:hypothetical protein
VHCSEHGGYLTKHNGWLAEHVREVIYQGLEIVLYSIKKEKQISIPDMELYRYGVMYLDEGYDA